LSVLIRTASPKDAALLASLHGACFDEVWNEEAFRRLLDRAGAIALVASLEAETESQGFVLAQVAADECEILSIGSVRPARRKGLARALVMAAGERAHRLGAREMFLEVAEDNGAAFALYRGAGFTIIGRRVKYYRRADGTALDAVMLRATLPL
jgi:ribosomal-protein-alanine N-acetyltransferase